MASTDRAFRALARSEPRVVLALLRVALPDFMPEVPLTADTVEDPRLDIPPPLEADLVARAGSRDLLHVEGQGYGERAFETRVFKYHLILTLRYPERDVHTVALWFIQPPPGQRLRVIQHGTVHIHVETIVLPELSANKLLEEPDTVCFAAGADAEGRTDEALCRLVARELRRQNAGWQRLLIAAAVAAAAGRYDAMIEAMTDAELDPPIIEDLVQYGRERGRREGVELGRREGMELGRRSDLLELIAARGLSLTPEQRSCIEEEHDSEQLLRWLRRAAVASSTAEIFSE